jgi:hypothetical protein
MSVNEILAEIDRLSPDELKAIREKVNSISDSGEESPELLAAVDEGLRSLREEGTIPIEEVKRRMKSWNFKSP